MEETNSLTDSVESVGSSGGVVDELVDSGMEVLVDVEATVVVVVVDGGRVGGITMGTVGNEVDVVVGSTGTLGTTGVTDVTVGATVTVVVVGSVVVVVGASVVVDVLVVVGGSVTDTVVVGAVVVLVVVEVVDVVVSGHVVVVSGVLVGVVFNSTRYDVPYHLFGSPQHTPVRSRYEPG